MKTNTMNASSPRLRAIARASGFSILAATTRRLLVPLQLQLHLHLHLRAALIAVAALLLVSCATHTVKSTTYTPIQRATEIVEAGIEYRNANVEQKFFGDSFGGALNRGVRCALNGMCCAAG